MSTIRVKSLRKKYGNTEALKGISFDIEKGEVVGFLGPNGAGKTTTMKVLTCFMSADSGEARVASHDCFKDTMEVRQKIGYLPENNPLYTDMTVVEYLRYAAELHDVEKEDIDDRIREVVVDCGLSEKLNEMIGNLSKGYRQRVGLAATLIHDPEILILDEPTAGLDPNQIVEIRNLIKQLGKEKTVILCSHLLAEVELTCNRIIILNKGKIVASGTPSELKGQVDDHVGIRVTIRGDNLKALSVLGDVAGVKEVTERAVREKGAHGYDLITAKKKDLRGDITKAIFENELDLLEIHREAVSLEELFNQVTK